MTLELILRFLHSWNRWLLLVISIVTAVYFVRGWLTGQAWTKSSRILLSTFAGLVGLQWLLGLIFLLRLGSLTGFGIRHYWEHLTMQTIAMIVAHLYVLWNKQELDDRIRYQRSVLLVSGTLVLIVIGVMTLPSSIQWRFMGM